MFLHVHVFGIDLVIEIIIDWEIQSVKCHELPQRTKGSSVFGGIENAQVNHCDKTYCDSTGYNLLMEFSLYLVVFLVKREQWVFFSLS